MTNGFVKKTNKTPKKEILKAKRYQYDYMNDNKYMFNGKDITMNICIQIRAVCQINVMIS